MSSPPPYPTQPNPHAPPSLPPAGKNNISLLQSDSQGMHGPASTFTPMAHHAGKASASNIVVGPYGITSMGKSLPSRETSGERAARPYFLYGVTSMGKLLPQHLRGH